MDPLGNLVDWIAIYGIFGLFAIGLAERFLPALPSYGVLVAIGIAADDEVWSLHTAVIGTTIGSLIGALGLYLVVRAVGKSGRPPFSILLADGWDCRELVSTGHCPPCAIENVR